VIRRPATRRAVCFCAMRELIDLSHEVEPGMITVPGLPGPIVSDFLGRADSRRTYRGEAEFHIGRIERQQESETLAR